VEIHRLTPEDLPRLRDFWIQHWGADFVVAHGVIYRPAAVDGFVAEHNAEWVGEITYTIVDTDCEIVSLDSLREGQGVGTKLIQAVFDEAQKQGCKRIFVITTNDNLNALGFYQKRGFELVKINRGALIETRKLKPGIPFIGANNIPLRDEIELEMIL